MQHNYTTKTIKETGKLAGIIAKKLVPGSAIIISGNLGVGKTAFIRFMAGALGVKKSITSPTFVLMNVYKKKKFSFIHIDCYKIENENELISIGAKDYFADKNSIIAVEWPEMGGKILKRLLKLRKKIIDVKIYVTKNGSRRFTIK